MARGSLWFRENRVWNKGASGILFVQHFGATLTIWVPFWIPSDFEGGPQIYYFWKNRKQITKKDVQETALKKHDLFLSIVDANIRGLKC